LQHLDVLFLHGPILLKSYKRTSKQFRYQLSDYVISGAYKTKEIQIGVFTGETADPAT